MSEIRLFMSGYQRHFWISARHAAEALRALDKELHVERPASIVRCKGDPRGGARPRRRNPRLRATAPRSCRSAIDGAVFIESRGVCFAIGAILDGLATPQGDPARGARYNSSVRYVSGKPHCLAMVISEDGSVEWLAGGADLADRGAGGQ